VNAKKEITYSKFVNKNNMLFYALLRRKLPLYLYITAFVYLPPIAQYSISSAMKTDISNIEHI